MKKLRIRHLGAWLLPVAAFAAFGPGMTEQRYSRQASSKAAAGLTIAVSTNRKSELEPCGCKRNQRGGIDREAKIYENLEAEGATLLQLDGGGFIDQIIVAAPTNRKAQGEVIKTRYMFQAMKAVGYDAINVAAADYFYGLERLKDESKGLALISANIREPAVAELPFDPFRLIEATLGDGTKARVAVIGLSGKPGASTPVPPKAIDRQTAMAVPSFQQLSPVGDVRVAQAPEAAAEPMSPAERVRVVEEASSGSFAPEISEENLYLYKRAMPGGGAPAARPAPMTPEQRIIRETIENQGQPQVPAIPGALPAVSPANASDPTSATTRLFIPAGAFDTRALRGEAPKPATPASAAPSAVPAPAPLPAPAPPVAKPAPNPHKRTASAWNNDAMRWHREAAKGDDAPAASETKEEAKNDAEAIADEFTLASDAKTADITETDPAAKAALASVRAKLAAMDSAEAYTRNGDTVEMIDPRAALEVTLSGARPLADYVVLLYFDNQTAAANTTKGLMGIDSMITMEVGSRANRAADVNGISTFRVAYDGRMVGLLELERDAEKGWVSNVEMVEVESDKEAVPAISKYLEAYKQAANSMTFQPTPTVVEDKNKDVLYVGANACKECHPAEHANWMTTPHSTAIQTLIDDNAENNPNCIECHVTGMNDGVTARGGFLNMERTVHMANVQCEECHGDGWKHVTAMRRAAYYERTNRDDVAANLRKAVATNITKTPAQETCLKCHTPKTSDFDFKERLPFANHSQPYPDSRREAREAHSMDSAAMMKAFSAEKTADGGKNIEAAHAGAKAAG